MKVVLPADELQRAYAVGERRASRAEANGWTLTNVHTGADNHVRHREAAGSELAVALMLDAEWSGEDINAFRHKPDVMPDIEVRRIRKPDWPLIVYKKDVPERRYVLTYGQAGTYDVLGWIRGCDAPRIGVERQLYRITPPVFAWFVDQDDLEPLWPLWDGV